MEIESKIINHISNYEEDIKMPITKEKTLENLNNHINDLNERIEVIDVVLAQDDLGEDEKIKYSKERSKLIDSRDSLRGVLNNQNENIAKKIRREENIILNNGADSYTKEESSDWARRDISDPVKNHISRKNSQTKRW